MKVIAMLPRLYRDLVAITVLSSLCSLQGVQAAGFLNPLYEIKITYELDPTGRPPQASITLPDNTKQLIVDDTTTIQIPSRSKPEIKVLSANKVLFLYQIDEVTTTQNQNNKNIEEFLSKLSAGLINPAAAPAAAPVGARAAAPVGAQKMRICELKKLDDLDPNDFFNNQIKKYAEVFSVDPVTGEKDWNLPKAIEKISLDPNKGVPQDTLTGTWNFNKDFSENLAKIKAIASPNRNGNIKVHVICDSVPETREITNLVNLPNLADDLNSPSLRPSLVEEVSKINYIMFFMAEYQGVLILAADLEKELNNIGKDYILESSTPIVVDYAHDSKIVFSISKNPKFSSFLTKATVERQDKIAGIGKKSLALTITDEYSVTLAPGAVYSFVQNPQFAVISKNGQLVISQTSNDYNKVDGAIVLNISKSKYEGQNFIPQLQLGAIAKSSQFGILLGGGFHTAGNWSFGVGVIYQKATVLKAGLSVGQVVSSNSDLQTESEYKAGPYLSLSYDIAPKK